MQCIIDSLLHETDPSISLDWVTTAEAALKKIERAGMHDRDLPYSLVIADIFLDGKTTGIDMWSLCRRVYPKMPVLVISALPLDRFRDFYASSGEAPLYIQKPFDLGECRKTLKRILQQPQASLPRGELHA